jgi:hypothetical protein
MRRLAVLAAVLLGGCRPWCAQSAETWTPAAYGAEAGAVAATDELISREFERGRGRPLAELDAAARAVGADDAAELAAVARGACLSSVAVGRFARARGLSVPTTEAYLAARFGVAVCGEP